MKINILYKDKLALTLDVEPTYTIQKVKEIISDKLNFSVSQQTLEYEEEILENDKTLNEYEIGDEYILVLSISLKASFDNVKNEIKNYLFKNLNKINDETNKDEKNMISKSDDLPNENKNVIKLEQIKTIKEKNISNDENITIDNADELFKKYLKRDELYVNLIFFDLKMTNKDNYRYFNQFKIDVVGGFHAIDDLNILENYLEKIKEKDIPFIIISSGSSGKDVIELCKKYSFIKEVIIFCNNLQYNMHYIEEYPDFVKKVLNKRKKLYKYIKTFGADKYKDGIEKYLHEDKYIFSSDQIEMDKQLQQCPLISAYEYDNCYFLVHKIYSNFFGDINNAIEESMFKTENLKIIIEYLNQLSFEKDKERQLMIKIFKSLVNFKSNDKFVEESIKQYTGESYFCYLFNRVMRNFEKGLISFAYYMGPLLYGLNKYVKDNPNFAFSKSMKLYRIIKCTNLDFYQYKLNLGHIICFPSLTSTSSVPIKFKPTKLSQKICNNKKDEMIPVKMIFKYIHNSNNKSPGIIIEDKKTKAGSYLSIHPKEKEIILFPFTFAKIEHIKTEKENGVEVNVIYFEIINRNSYIEYTLKNDFENRILFYKLEEEKK
jgi:hypothetical protein